MRERVKQLGGSFEIRSNASGTVITAVFPLPEIQEDDNTNPASDTSVAVRSTVNFE
jgi:signal transduction histidine kinase